MFQKGEYIVYGHQGICLVEDITHLNMSGADKEKLYYVLTPLHVQGSHIYYPVDRENANARELMKRDEVLSLLEKIPDIAEVQVVLDKFREDSYKKALHSGDSMQWMSLVKTLHLRRKDRLSKGKKIASVDERYLKLAEDVLYEELAFVLGEEKENLKQTVREKVEKCEQTVEH